MNLTADAHMTTETTRRWDGISRELGRLKNIDQNVYAEVVSLLARINLLESDNDALRAELSANSRFEGKE